MTGPSMSGLSDDRLRLLECLAMRPNGAVIRDAKDQENVKAMALMWPPLVGNCYEMTDGTLVASITADGRAALNQARATRGGLL